MAKRSRTVSGAATTVVSTADVGGDGNLANVADTPTLKENELPPTELKEDTPPTPPVDGDGVTIDGDASLVEGDAGDNPQETEGDSSEGKDLLPEIREEDKPTPLVDEVQQLGGYVAAAQAATAQNATEAEPSGARSDVAEDMSIVAALSNYVETMAGNRRTKDDVLIKQQMNLYRVIKTICDSQQNDVMRRWGILLYYIDQGSGTNGAFTGNLPFRKLSQLPPQVQPLMEGLLGFLVAVGPETTRGTAIRHLAIPQVASALPLHARDSFMSFFGQFV